MAAIHVILNMLSLYHIYWCPVTRGISAAAYMILIWFVMSIPGKTRLSIVLDIYLFYPWKTKSASGSNVWLSWALLMDFTSPFSMVTLILPLYVQACLNSFLFWRDRTAANSLGPSALCLREKQRQLLCRHWCHWPSGNGVCHVALRRREHPQVAGPRSSTGLWWHLGHVGLSLVRSLPPAGLRWGPPNACWHQ